MGSKYRFLTDPLVQEALRQPPPSGLPGLMPWYPDTYKLGDPAATGEVDDAELERHVVPLASWLGEMDAAVVERDYEGFASSVSMFARAWDQVPTALRHTVTYLVRVLSIGQRSIAVRHYLWLMTFYTIDAVVAEMATAVGLLALRRGITQSAEAN